MLYPLSYEGGDEGQRTVGPRRSCPAEVAFAAMPDRTVLVVDDDPVILKLLEVNFEMEGFAVITAGDGDDGLRAIREQRPDAVVLDIMMPKLNGLEVLEAARADPATKNVPIVLLSAKAQASEVQRGLDLGADDYVTKPLDPIDLVERVNAVLHNTQIA